MSAASIRRFRLLCAALMMAALGGCLSLIKEPDPIATYSLRPETVADDGWKSADWALTVIRPNTSAFLDTNRIAVRPEPNVLQVYKGANWSDTLPDLVQTAVVEGFENSGKIKTVSRQNSGVPAEVALLLDIREFEAVYAPGARIPAASIRIHAKLLQYPSNRVIAIRTFSTDVPAASKRIPDVIQAFEQGMVRINGEIVGWSLANGHGKAK
ncbi:hypothetical protein GCM10010960_06790 [Arenimonas maotaiensis]|uniref:ABC-type transport auxiliary lipoprotein component domain-containing protein n=1 Tax=Arenimonas maotaiensis TaxID=1446479 RepID=A0A917CI35_9GAMM|nr:ABC-type transport auxiliary lipoprotein family protein [Arenimonas maotaiensis]GGF87498.1 hypothetical protein GCM10010960_06790 [Arenimonas maotaiensis]